MDSKNTLSLDCVKQANTQESLKQWIGISLVIASAALVSCAGNPPKESLSQAQLAVNKASETRADQFAPLKLRMARDHLNEANRALQNKDYDEARRLAEKAVVEAELAEATAEAETAKMTVAELRQSIDALREEVGTE